MYMEVSGLKTQRKPWLDALRALAMLFVMVGHASHRVGPYFSWTSAVKIPLFFAISGYLFHADGYTSFGKFVWAKFRRLMIPYFCLAVLSSLCLSAGKFLFLNESIGDLVRTYARNLLTGETLWFVPCLFWVEILLYGIHQAARNSAKLPGWAVHVGLTALSLAASLPWTLTGRSLPWNPNIALAMVFFAQLGYLLRRYEDRLLSARLWQALAVVALYCLLCIIEIRTGLGKINVKGSRWPCLPLNLLTCATGVFGLFLLFPKLPIPRFAVFMGQNTLVWYAFHQFFQMGAAMILLKVFSFLPDPEVSVPMGVIVALVACIFCSIASLIINRFFPFMVGRKPVR